MKRTLKFIGCTAFYAAVGTIFASLIAWSMILMVSAGAILMPVIGGMIDDPTKIFHTGTAVVLGVVTLSAVTIGAIGYAVAPFVGAWIGWKSAIAISLVMALMWNRYETKRHALHISPVIGALGALLTPLPAFGGQDSQGLVWVGIAISSVLSVLFVTLIARSWLERQNESGLPSSNS
jgi:hypothetical protein